MTTSTSEILELMKAMQHIAAMKKHIENGHPLLELTMLNGKRLGDCTGLECREEGEWLVKMSEVADRIHAARG